MLLFRYIFLLLVIINFSACGFQLRQSASLPQSMLNTYIETRDNRSIFSRKLKQQLLSNNAKVVDKRTNASAIIKILEDETGRRVLSVSARNIATEYEIFYRIVFSLVENGKNSFVPNKSANSAKANQKNRSIKPNFLILCINKPLQCSPL